MLHVHNRSSAGSFVEEDRRRARAEALKRICDKRLAIGDDEIDELEKIDHNAARMLERGTGKLKRCMKCKMVEVVPIKKHLKWGGLDRKRGGYVCYYCHIGSNKSTPKSLRKRVVMEKVWRLYMSRVNEGVTIHKINADKKR